MIAAFQPDGAEKLVEVSESAIRGRLQMHPVIGRVTGFHDQVEPAWSRFAGHGYRVLFPAGFEMIGHLAFAKRPVAKATFGRGELVIHSSRMYRKGQSDSSPFYEEVQSLKGTHGQSRHGFRFDKEARAAHVSAVNPRSEPGPDNGLGSTAGSLFESVGETVGQAARSEKTLHKRDQIGRAAC